MSDQIKQAFIQQSLQDYQRRVVQRMRQAVTQRKAKKTGDLKNSITGSASATGNSGTASIKFKEYGRFVDMGVGRGHPLGGMAALQQNLILASGGEKRNAKSPRKAKKIYSKVAYGQLGTLMSDLAYGYTQETINQIKSQLQPNSTTQTQT